MRLICFVYLSGQGNCNVVKVLTSDLSLFVSFVTSTMSGLSGLPIPPMDCGATDVPLVLRNV